MLWQIPHTCNLSGVSLLADGHYITQRSLGGYTGLFTRGGSKWLTDLSKVKCRASGWDNFALWFRHIAPCTLGQVKKRRVRIHSLLVPFPSLGCSPRSLQVSPKSETFINHMHLIPCFRLCFYGAQPMIAFQFLSIILKVTIKMLCSGRPSN